MNARVYVKIEVYNIPVHRIDFIEGLSQLYEVHVHVGDQLVQYPVHGVRSVSTSQQNSYDFSYIFLLYL